MDRALKERIVGAVVLVVVAVLVVPVFLDGPSMHNETLTEPVLLPGQTGESRKQQTVVLERDRDQPVPANSRAQPPDAGAAQPSGSPEAAAPVAGNAEKTPPAVGPAVDNAPKPQRSAEPTGKPKPIPEPKPEAKIAEDPPATVAAQATAPAESATGMWAVQLGSFSDQANAERLAADLRSQGYAAFLSRLQTSANLLHRVRVGPQESRESAENIAAQLQKNGHKGQVVPHP
jgi:DedD protein